jgi:hypothetical protein
MKTKKRPTKRRKKAAMVSLLTGSVHTAGSAPGFTSWYPYPTLPPRKMTWGDKVKEIARRMGVL